MAIDSFYISIEMTPNEQNQIKNTVVFETYKRSINDLVYKKNVYIDNINNEEGCWWHLNAGYLNFFDGCEALYDLCLIINKIIPQFSFTVFQQRKTVFETLTFIEFMHHIYEIVKSSKQRFNDEYGRLSIIPTGYNFYKFRRKNKKYFIREKQKL